MLVEPVPLVIESRMDEMDEMLIAGRRRQRFYRIG